MSDRTVLVSGAGVAGPTLAYRLARQGFRPTVVERAQGTRSSGNPVDVRGPAVPVAEGMGIMPRLRAAGTHVTGMSFLDPSGRRVSRVNMRAMARAAGSREVELPRGALAAILYDASRDDAEYLFDDTITALHQDDGGVDVTFDRAAPRRFDLVIGADGLHSSVRRLVFGPEPDFVRHMGLYIATVPLGVPAEDDREVLLHNTPGKAVSIHPARGNALVAFIFRSPPVPGYDHRDMEQHKQIVTAAYQGGSWRVPELLDRLQEADDVYFDSVSQVRLPHWSHGRVALLGDAASSVSLFGEGSSLAMAGAATLAGALAASPGDHQAAFRRYEATHRTLVAPKQRAVSQAAALIVPATQRGIVVRNLAARLWPVAAAAQWVGRRTGRPSAPMADVPTARAEWTAA